MFVFIILCSYINISDTLLKFMWNMGGDQYYYLKEHFLRASSHVEEPECKICDILANSDPLGIKSFKLV